MRYPKSTPAIRRLPGRAHLDVRALDIVRSRLADILHTPEVRRILRWLEPRAQKAQQKRERKVRIAMDNPFKLAISKAVSTTERKRVLKAECEALCKAIVKNRDLDADGWGRCNTCGSRSNGLQWCHFISRHNGKNLIYRVENTAMGCGRCNGPGMGEYARFRDWLEARKPGLPASLEAEATKVWKWTTKTLEVVRDDLKAKAGRRGLDVEKILASVTRKPKTKGVRHA